MLMRINKQIIVVIAVFFLCVKFVDANNLIQGNWIEQPIRDCLFSDSLNKQVVLVEIVNGGLEITYREFSNCFVAVYPACEGHTRIWKEIYKAKEEKIYLEKTIEAKYTPSSSDEIKEKIEWIDK